MPDSCAPRDRVINPMNASRIQCDVTLVLFGGGLTLEAPRPVAAPATAEMRDHRFHDISVKLTRNDLDGVRVRARKGYVVRSPASRHTSVLLTSSSFTYA